MNFLVFAGSIAFISGILFILFPNWLTAVTRWANKLAADMDSTAIKYRIGLGISLILTGACLWFVAYYMAVMPVLTAINAS